MLLPLSALSGVGRRPLFEDADFPLRTVYVYEHRLTYDGPDAQIEPHQYNHRWMVCLGEGLPGQADCGVDRVIESYRRISGILGGDSLGSHATNLGFLLSIIATDE